MLPKSLLRFVANLSRVRFARRAQCGGPPPARAGGHVTTGLRRLCGAWLVGVAFACALPAWAQARNEVRVGVLAFRSLEQTAQHWDPTARHLEQVLPGRRFRIVPLHHDALDVAVAAGQIEFVLTQPEQFVLLRAQHGLAAIATLVSLADGTPVTRLGGVIFTRAERADIATLADVRGRSVAAVHEHSLGGYRAQQWTLRNAGIELPRDVRSLRFTDQPQDRVVVEVVAGRAEVGFVRTGVLEAMTREGKIRPGELRVINPQAGAQFPLPLSTELYPEWPLAALRGVPEPLVKAVALALLGVSADSEAALAGGYQGFSPPGDYAPLEAVMLRLRAHPDRLAYFDILDIAEKYEQGLVTGLMLVLAATLAVVLRMIRDNRRIGAAARERALLLGSLGEGVFGVGPDGRCTFINPAALAMLGLAEAEVVGRDRHALFHHHRPDGSDYPPHECPIHRTLADGQRRVEEEWFLRGDGSAFPVSIHVTPMRRGAAIVGAVIAFQDIAERKRIEADLGIAAVAFETQEAIFISDAASRILRVNRAFTRVTGYSAEEVLGRTPSMLKSDRHDVAFYREMWRTLASEGHWQGEMWNRRKNGEDYPEWLTITAVRNAEGVVCHYVAAFLDMTQRKRAEQQIEYMALYDPLTDLPNRRLLRERVVQALATSHRTRRHGALLFIDLDNFKTLNDTRGHDVGDRLLVQVARRLRKCVREGDTVARLGGDEFVAMLEGFSSAIDEALAQIKMVSELIVDELNLPYQLDEGEHHSSASIGITLFRETDVSFDELLKRADLAMYQAKAAGRNTLRFFDPAMQAAVERRALLEADLRRALRQGEFLLHHQPQVNRAGELLGAEALLRWRHPERGMVMPGEFIPLAEASGLIVPIGQWVLEAACAQLAAWQQDPLRAGLTLAINVSARQFRRPEFAHQVRVALAVSRAPAARLKLELTESLLLEGVEEVIERMMELKALGVSFSLDDFGTGYSSLAYLKRLPLDQLKIDQSFVRDVLTDENDAAIARTILALGRTFGLTVIAEGVETEGQREFLVRHGCDAFQGYLFGEPAEVEALPGFRAQHTAKLARSRSL